QVEQRRFARAVGTDQATQFAWRQGEVQVIDGKDSTEGFGETLGAQQRRSVAGRNFHHRVSFFAALRRVDGRRRRRCASMTTIPSGKNSIVASRRMPMIRNAY